MDVRVGLWRKLSAEELMLLNCGVGEDSWESLGLQGDPTSPFWKRSVLGVHWKDWCWGWISDTLATSWKELTHWKRPWCSRDWGQEEKGTTEDEMAGWHHWIDEHEFEWIPGVGYGQGCLVCCDSWDRKESDMTERLNWTEEYFMGFPRWWETLRDVVLILGSGEEHGNPPQYSCLENPMDRGASRLLSMGSQKVGHDWSNLACHVMAQEFFV